MPSASTQPSAPVTSPSEQLKSEGFRDKALGLGIALRDLFFGGRGLRDRALRFCCYAGYTTLGVEGRQKCLWSRFLAIVLSRGYVGVYWDNGK